MAQLSLPYRVGLAGILVFALAWFVVLKPKPSTDGGGAPAPTAASTPAAPGTKGLQTAIDKAKGAVAGSRPTTAVTTNTATPPVAVTAATKPATGKSAAAAAKAQSTDPSSVILADVTAGKTAVVLFSAKQGADDRHVRASLHKLDRHHGKVAIRSASIDDVANYAAITKGVSIVQAPTLLVIGKDLKARAIVGYTDRNEIQQLVNDVGGFR